MYNLQSYNHRIFLDFEVGGVNRVSGGGGQHLLDNFYQHTN